MNYDLFFGVFTNPDIPSMEREENSRMSLVRFHAQVKVNWQPESHVGLVESFTISYFNPDGRAHVMSIDDLNRVTVFIKRQNETRQENDNSLFTEVTFTIELIDENVHVVKFGVKKSGTYIIAVKIDDGHIKGSPFFHKFVPGLVCPKKSTLRTYPSAYFTMGDEHVMTLEVRDAFENLCQGKDVLPKLIQLTLTHMDSYENGENLKTGDFNLQISCGDSGKLILTVEVLRSGTFRARLEYASQMVENGIFSFVVLKDTEMDSVKTFLQQHPLGPYVFEAEIQNDIPEQQNDGCSMSEPGVGTDRSQLLPLTNHESATTLPRKTKVKVFLSSRNIIVSKAFLKYFHRRILSTKVTLHTWITIVSADPLNNMTIIEISDGYFQIIRLTVSSETLRIATAILTHFVRKKFGNAVNLSEKLAFFYEGLRKSREQYHFNATRIEISVDRDDLLTTAFNETERFSKVDWFRVFKVNFRREVGVDGGGIRREFFELLCIQLFEKSGLFSPMGNSRLVHPTPKLKRDDRWSTRNYNRMWEFAGKLVAKCLFESAMGGPFRLHVKAKFSRSFLAQLLGLKPDYKHFEHDDPELYTGKIKYILDNDVTPLNLTFTDEEYLSHDRVKEVELIPDGSSTSVTEANKHDYLTHLAIYRLQTRVEREIGHFIHGLLCLIPEDSLGIFDENELELLICGKSSFTLAEFQKFHQVGFEHFEYPYISAHSRIMEWFWIVVGNMTEDEKGRLLQFITGSSILPGGGFRRLRPTIEIKPIDEFGRFPQAHTCNNQLCLPDQPNIETFERRLLLAITEGCQGFEII